MFKLAAQNVLIFIMLWLSVLALIAIGNDVWHLSVKDMVRKTDPRTALPVYPDRGLAEKIFRDQKVADFDYVPFIEWRHKPYTSETVNIYERGYRSNGAQAAAGGGANRPTLGIFGGSTVWGTGVDDASTIPAFFQAANPDVQVTNYGERGYTTRQSLDELVNLSVAGTAPSVAVFYGGFNDIWVHCNYANTKGLNGHVREQRLRDALAVAEEERSSIYHYLVEPVVQLVTDTSGGGKQFIPGCSTDPKRAEAVAAMIVENWQIAHDLMVRHGGQFYAFLQPNAHVGSPNLSHLDLKGNRVLRGDEYRAVYPLIRKLAQERNLTWFQDVSDALDGDKAFYIDDAHVGPDGNKTIAGQITVKLKGKLTAAAPSL